MGSTSQKNKNILAFGIKKKNYFLYKNEIDDILGLNLAKVPSYANNNYWMYALQVDKKICGKDREQLMKYLSKNKIQTRPIWYINHLQKPYRDCQTCKIEIAYEMFEKTLNVPCSVNLKIEDLDYVVGMLKK